MQSLQIDEQKAKKLFKSAAPEFKEILVDSFGEAFFSEKITDRVKSFEDACSELGISSRTVVSEDDTTDEAAYKKLKVIVRALNEGWAPDWDNSNEYKYYPWFYMNSASGFSLGSVTCGYTFSNVGSRLCFKSEDLARYAAKQFLTIYKDYFTL